MSTKYIYEGKKPIAIEWIPDWFSRDDTSNMLILGAITATIITTAIVWHEINKNS